MNRLITALLAGLALAAAGCGSTATTPIPSSGQLERNGQVVLSALGAQRIGLQTAKTLAVPRRRHGAAQVIVPYSAVIYDPSGRTYAFTSIGPLTFVETPITVATISGSSAYLSRGPAAGSKVVSVGAEELYGVQTGVLAQT